MLFDDWYPVTQDFGVIRAPTTSVVDTFTQWHATLGLEYVKRRVTSSAADAFDSLLPLSHSKPRKLFMSPVADWTAYFQNGIDGSDPFPAMSYLARKLGVVAMRVCATPPGVVQPAVIWEVYGPPHLGGVPPLGYIRSISCSSEDGRWTFDDSGTPYEFENTEQYNARSKRTRFTREQLAKHLLHFGLEPFAEGFLIAYAERPAVVLDQHGPSEQSRHFTLEEVKRGVPWGRT